MILKIAADVIVLFHLAFIVFVALGGFLVLKWPKVACIHIPATIWGTLIEFAGWICPLTPLENRLRLSGGVSAYPGGFIDHYIVPVVYPEELTRGLQLLIGCAVIAVNAAVYGVFIIRRS